MHQSTSPSLSQTIWPRWASRQFLSPPTVQTLLPVTFGYSLSSEAVIMRQLRRWKKLWWRSLIRSHEDFHRAFQKLLERYKRCISAGGDNFKGDYSFMCVASIKVPIRKKSRNLFNDPRTNWLISHLWIHMLLFPIENSYSLLGVYTDHFQLSYSQSKILWFYFVWFSCVSCFFSWNTCGLFNAKFCLYIYISYIYHI